MSDDKRRSARTQSRFSSDKETPASRKEKQKGIKKGSKGGDKAKNDMPVVKTAAEGISVEYQENSNYSFKELEKKKKPEELKIQGIHELSTTEDGVSRLIYDSEFLLEAQADELMTILSDTTKWYDKNIVIRGEEFPQPRLVAWYGPFPYTYSGATLEAAEMPPTVLEIKQRVENFLKENGIDVELNSVLLNLYRNEKDSVAWHSDDELLMGVYPTIASVSLGSVRKFEMRPKLHTVKQNDGLEEDSIFYVNLTPGSLLVMDGCMQKDWQHRVPKEFHDRQPRINLTFRTVVPIDQHIELTRLPSQVPYSKVGNLSKTPDLRKSSDTCLDVENFPPLIPTIKKNVVCAINEVSCDNESDKHIVLANSHQNSDTESTANENENQNNLNKDLDSCTLEDSSHYNLMEPEKSSDKLSASDELENEFSEKSYSDNNFSSKKVCHETDIQPFQSIIDNGNKLEAPNKTSRKYQLNINAPDFIPKTSNMAEPVNTTFEPIYSRYDLTNLAKYYYSKEEMSSEEISDFLQVLLCKIEKARNGFFFLGRDWYELETLQRLIEGGQSEANQRVILDRICSIIHKCEYGNRRDNRSPHRYAGNRNGYGGDNYRSGRNYNRTYHRN